MRTETFSKAGKATASLREVGLAFGRWTWLKTHPEGPSTQYLRFLVPKSFKGVVFGTRKLEYWVLDYSGTPMSENVPNCAQLKPSLAAGGGPPPSSRQMHFSTHRVGILQSKAGSLWGAAMHQNVGALGGDQALPRRTRIWGPGDR